MPDELDQNRNWEFLLWLLRRRRRFRVNNNSMLPLLKPGDEVLMAPGAVPVPGDIVVAQHPLRRDVRLIKRVESIVEGRYVLKGDNPAESTDSRSFGPVTAEHIMGRVTSRFG